MKTTKEKRFNAACIILGGILSGYLSNGKGFEYIYTEGLVEEAYKFADEVIKQEDSEK